jgi:phosphatidylserine decarboxylase precursor-related protein
VAAQAALGLAFALAIVLPLARKWELRIASVTIVIAVGSVIGGVITALVSSTVALPASARFALVAALAVALGILLLAYLFYRDPERLPPQRDGAVVSPADGSVLYVRETRGGTLPFATKHGRDYPLEELTRTELKSGEAVVIGIGMSFSDVHVNRAPIAGSVTLCRHFPGRFGSLGRPGMVFENERATTVIEASGLQVAVVQIASRLVRLIVSFVAPGQTVQLGQRIGAIRFGSQVDVVLPLRSDVRVLVRPGERVRAGESVIATSAPTVHATRARASRASHRGDGAASQRSGAVVIGGDYRALGIARSLGRHGVPVWIVHEPNHRMAPASRYCAHSVRWQGPDEASRIELLVDLGERHGLGGWVLFATEDDTAALIARNADRLSCFALTTPEWDVLRWAYDKRLSYRLAEDAGVPYPKTLYPRDRDELQSLELDFPVILKPAVKETVNRFTRDKAWPAATREALLSRYDAAAKLVPADTIMVQELIPGGGESQFSFGALCEGGLSIASVIARRLRQYPIDFGYSSSCVETVDEPDVGANAARLLAALRYSGLIEVEFKRDPRDGALRLLDLNPRVWTWHSLAGRAGVDLPYLQWRLARGDGVDPQRARPGVCWVRPATDALAIAHLIVRRRERVRTVLRSFRRPLELAPGARDDQLPWLLALPMGAAALRARVTHRRAEVVQTQHRAAPSRPEPRSQQPVRREPVSSGNSSIASASAKRTLR